MLLWISIQPLVVRISIIQIRENSRDCKIASSVVVAKESHADLKSDTNEMNTAKIQKSRRNNIPDSCCVLVFAKNQRFSSFSSHTMENST